MKKPDKKAEDQDRRAGMEKIKDADQLLAQLPTAGRADTAYALVEIYESVERSYRAAMMAGQYQPKSTLASAN